MFLCISSGEFGSVMEGLLTQEESVLKVAVKTMKSKYRQLKHSAVTTMNPFISGTQAHLTERPWGQK